jgi:rubredoxin
MALTEKIPVREDENLSPRKRRCPDCGNYLFLELVFCEGYWWSCLMCGWSKPAKVNESQTLLKRAG